MKKQYFKLQLKRIFKIFPAVLLITVITFACLGLAGGALLNSTLNDESQKKFTIGMVGNTDDSFLDIGLQALQNMDSSRFYVEVKNFSEEEAIRALESREIIGYLDIPEDYIQNLYIGVNTPARYVTLDGPENLGSMFSEEIVKIVSELVVQSQNGMYSMQDLTYQYDEKDFNDNTNQLMMIYMNHILSRTQSYRISDLGVVGSLSLGGYYLCGMIMLFLLLWGISCNRIFSGRNPDYNRLLKISGISSTTQVLGEYGAYAVVSTLMMLIFSVISGIILQFVKLPVPELANVKITDCVCFVFQILPVILMITMMQYAFYELIPNFVGAVLTQFLTFMLLGYLSGCFYPNFFFPDTLRSLMEALPVGLGFSFLRKMMTKELVFTDFSWVFAYAGLFFVVTVNMRKYRITGDFK